jgi:sRNA-binding regulator protein Hfq
MEKMMDTKRLAKPATASTAKQSKPAVPINNLDVLVGKRYFAFMIKQAKRVNVFFINGEVVDGTIIAVDRFHLELDEDRLLMKHAVGRIELKR